VTGPATVLFVTGCHSWYSLINSQDVIHTVDLYPLLFPWPWMGQESLDSWVNHGEMHDDMDRQISRALTDFCGQVDRIPRVG